MISYYVTKLQGDEYRSVVNLEDPTQGTQIDWSGFMSKTVFWCLAAVALGLILGLVGSLAQNRDIRGLPFQLVIPLIVIVETTMRLRAEASLQEPIVGATWSVTRVAAGIVIVVLIGRAAIVRWPWSSTWQERR
ncbi:hypothetical protein [Streptomyces kebangsaanensis]|uniref:hypothetical protein n=1 Tax=Streptomyces kebangsaanensis TaxID=864058 RepID=UPI001F37CDAB|nr:hypothetical protein [Streptomyces kebangsaanensis]